MSAFGATAAFLSRSLYLDQKKGGRKKRNPSPVVTPELCSPRPRSNCTSGIIFSPLPSAGYEKENNSWFSGLADNSCLFGFSFNRRIVRANKLKHSRTRLSPGKHQFSPTTGVERCLRRRRTVSVAVKPKCKVSMTTGGTMLPLFPALCWFLPHNSIS